MAVSACAFAGVVVMVGGNIPGITHDEIKRLVVTCGAAFEERDIAICTHMITSHRYVEEPGGSSLKVRVARTLPNCQIVSVDWLVESVLENRPLNAVDYLLVAAENTSVFSENRSDTPQLPVVPRTNLQIYHERLIDLVDDRFNAKGATVAVWMDEQGVRWDAFLISGLKRKLTLNPDINFPNHQVSTYRIQLLYNFEFRTYRIWYREVVNQVEMSELSDNDDLEIARRDFEHRFEEVTGESWKDHCMLSQDTLEWNPSTKRYIFFQPKHEDEYRAGNSLPEQDDVIERLPRGVSELIKLLFGPGPGDHASSFYRHILKNEIRSCYSLNLDGLTLRIAVDLLTKLVNCLEKPLACSEAQSRSSERLHMQKARFMKEMYFGLLRIARRSVSTPEATNLEWARQELRNIELLLKLRLCVEQKQRDGHLPKEIALKAFRTLEFEEIKRVNKTTREYTHLLQYLKNSIGAHHPTDYEWTSSAFHAAVKNKDTMYGEQRIVTSSVNGFCSGMARQVKSSLAFSVRGFELESLRNQTRYSASSFNQGLLLLCEVEVGKDPLCLVNCNQKASAVMRAEHKVGVFAQGRVGHKAWMDARVVRQSLNGILMPDTSKGRVMNHNAPTLAYNEYVVYDPAQVRQRYLFHLVSKVSR
ncbi:hypothetical protein PDE_09749 [Penicillium oxalicum 114-2]|uniref:NAD(+) ADP-ribosyltransferase n=1 Tax=Penicillium oxalicum (strain 114-2 / CGMCC 5302) TaxID=933388 RepID=S7ZVM6_PENO1|nr:hypothetical protein PDE_09749 [Penicillium oxalicum 114-2]